MYIDFHDENEDNNHNHDDYSNDSVDKNDEDISIVTVLMSYHNKYYLLIINKNSNNYSTSYRPSG